MILPHYLAIHVSGDVVLNEEYSQFKWVPLDKLDKFAPKAATIPEMVRELLRLTKIVEPEEYVLI